MSFYVLPFPVTGYACYYDYYYYYYYYYYIVSLLLSLVSLSIIINIILCSSLRIGKSSFIYLFSLSIQGKKCTTALGKYSPTAAIWRLSWRGRWGVGGGRALESEEQEAEPWKKQSCSKANHAVSHHSCRAWARGKKNRGKAGERKHRRGWKKDYEGEERQKEEKEIMIKPDRIRRSEGKLREMQYKGEEVRGKNRCFPLLGVYMKKYLLFCVGKN